MRVIYELEYLRQALACEVKDLNLMHLICQYRRCLYMVKKPTNNHMTDKLQRSQSKLVTMSFQMCFA